MSLHKLILGHRCFGFQASSARELQKCIRDAIKDGAPMSKWSYLAQVEKSLSDPNATVMDISALAWSLNKLALDDARSWNKAVARLIELNKPGVNNLSAFLFSAANAIGREPSLLSTESRTTLSNTLRQLLEDKPFLASASLADISQLCYSVSTMFPKQSLSRPIFQRATEILTSLPTREGSDGIPVLSSCKELVLLWSCLRMRRSRDGRIPHKFLEALLESSRGLRYCEDMNQNKIGQLSDSVSVLGITDPRIVFQIIHFVDTNESGVNSRNLLRIIRAMNRLGIDNEILWKRIANRLEQPIGLDYSVKELEDIQNAFSLMKNNRRILGILDLYIKTKLDAARYGTF